MGRSLTSAKAAGEKFNWDIARYLSKALNDRNITKAPSWGARDKGDVVNVRIDGYDLVIQTKNLSRLDLPGGTEDAKLQALNAGAIAGLLVHKRKGTTDPARQWVTMTMAELVALITKVPVTPGPEGE